MTPSVSTQPGSTTSSWTWVSLAVVVAAALFLRLALAAGVVMIDDLGYSQAAHDLLAGRFRLQPWPGGQARVGLYAPVAALYGLFGASETTSLLFPLLSSLASVVVVFGIGRLLAGDRAGLVAALLWAVCPLDVLAAGSLLPDGPMTMLVGAAVFFLLRAESRRPLPGGGLYIAAAACLAWAVLVKPLALIVVPFAVLYVAAERKVGGGRRWFVLALAAGGGAIYAAYYAIGAAPTVTAGPAVLPFSTRLAATATDWTHRLLADPVFAAATPLAIVSVGALLGRPEGRSWIALMWAACTFLLFEFASMSLREYMPIPATLRASQFLPVLAPLALVSGVHLGRTVSDRVARRAVIVAALLVVACAAVLRARGPLVSLAVTGHAPGDLPLATLAGIALGIATVGALFSACFIDRGRPAVRAAALGLLLAAIGVASVHAAQVAVLGFRDAWHENLPAVARFLRDQPEKEIYLQNAVSAARLNVASSFGLGFDYFAPGAGPGRLRVAPPRVDDLVDPSLVVIDDEMVEWSVRGGLGEPPACFRTPPTDWALVFSAGTIPGHRTRVYRFSLSGAQRELEEATRAASASPGVETLSRLVGAAAAARDYCASADAWTQLSALSPTAAEPFDASSLLRACYTQDPGAFGGNLLRNGDFAQGTEEWGSGPDTKADRSVTTDPATGAHAVRVDFRGGSWAVMTQAAPLEPGSAYVYTMRVRTTVPIVALYWQADVGHPFAENQVYREWTTLVSAFVTPAWNGSPAAASFSPVLMMAPGEAWVADVRLVRFQPRGRR